MNAPTCPGCALQGRRGGGPARRPGPRARGRAQPVAVAGHHRATHHAAPKFTTCIRSGGCPVSGEHSTTLDVAALTATVDEQAAALGALSDILAAYGALVAGLVDHIESGGQ